MDRVKAGAVLGGTVGLLAGLVFGGYSLIRYDLPAHLPSCARPNAEA